MRRREPGCADGSASSRRATARQAEVFVPPEACAEYAVGRCGGTRRAGVWPKPDTRDVLRRRRLAESASAESNLANKSTAGVRLEVGHRGLRLRSGRPSGGVWLKPGACLKIEQGPGGGGESRGYEAIEWSLLVAAYGTLGAVEVAGFGSVVGAAGADSGSTRRGGLRYPGRSRYSPRECLRDPRLRSTPTPRGCRCPIAELGLPSGETCRRRLEEGGRRRGCSSGRS